MSETVAEKTAEHIGESARQACCASSAIADAVEDGMGALRLCAKQSGDAAEEFLSDTSQRIQRHPALAVATTFAMGIVAGILVGWTMKRR